MSLESYVDADFANCVDDHHFISGYEFFLAGGPISCRSRSQPIVALRTKAEYNGVSDGYTGGLLATILMEEMGLNVSTSIILKEGKKAYISFSDHPEHIDYS